MTKHNSISLFIFFLLFSIGQIALGQKQEKIYYDKDWKGCSQSKAYYFRIANFDSYGKPTGIVRDYYITGELQSEMEGATYIDKANDYDSKFYGKCIGYYKSGKINFENIRDETGNYISNTHWYENGNIKFEANFKNGQYHGPYTSYFESGKIQYKIEYYEGKPIDKWIIECDEFANCQKVFYEGFTTGEDENGWEPVDGEQCESKIIAEQGFLMKNKYDGGYAQWINLPIDFSVNFSIETIINFMNGEKNSAHGLIYGFKDWNNYFYFIITANGKYHIGAIIDGLNFEYQKWATSYYINKNNSRNLIKINKAGEQVYFSINGQIVATEDFYPFKGNNIGFYIASGKKSVLFENLIVRQDNSDNNVTSNSSSKSDWQGNGTGFFIDVKGYIATNYHVVENATDIEIDYFQNGQKKTYKAEVISTDKQNDLAVIKIEDKNFKAFSKLPYNFKTQISDVGSNVFALGYPMALSMLGEEVKFTDGKISSKTGFQGDITTYQISVPIQPGNSGGPLFDYDGNIIGITNAGIDKAIADNVAYAIKSSYLKNLIDVLPETLNVPSDSSIISKTLTEKIKIISDYVVLIKIR